MKRAYRYIACAGPCDSAAPPPYDLGVYFLVAVSYER